MVQDMRCQVASLGRDQWKIAQILLSYRENKSSFNIYTKDEICLPNNFNPSRLITTFSSRSSFALSAEPEREISRQLVQRGTKDLHLLEIE